MTTANYTPSALRKAAMSVPRVLTLNGEQIVSIMIEHSLGVKPSSSGTQKLDIDSDYFAAFEAMKNLFAGRMSESASYGAVGSAASASDTSSDNRTVDLRPEEDLISLNDCFSRRWQGCKAHMSSEELALGC